MAKAKLELMQGNADIDQSKADFNSMMREADGLLEENEVALKDKMAERLTGATSSLAAAVADQQSNQNDREGEMSANTEATFGELHQRVRDDSGSVEEWSRRAR